MSISDTKLNELTAEAIRLLKDLIAIPAYSKEEDHRADYLQAYCNQRMQAHQRIGNNIILGTTIPGIPSILLNSHIDTIIPSPTWTTDPHTPIITEDKIIGLGANDAGASVISLLMVYLYFKPQKLPFNLIYAASAEEEISGQNGILKVIEHLGDIELAIVGEPTGMDMAVAEKGLMVIDAVAPGISGHAAREEGKNAIYVAMDDIECIRNFKFDKISNHLGSTKTTVTVIQAGIQHNVIPDTCKYVIDVRSNELYTNQELYHLLQSKVNSVLTPRSYRLNASHISMDHPIVKKGLSLGLSSYGSPTLSDQALMPYTSIKIGPGQSSRSHTAGEYIEIEEIRSGIKTYIELLSGLQL